jgi:hypothetical protein
LISSCDLFAQDRYEFLLNSGDTIISDIRFFGGLTHQHQDFFNKTFSFQGIETGVLLNHKLLLGVYGSAFVSNLEVELETKSMYFSISQMGLVFGTVHNDLKLLHTGLLLNLGYISIVGDDSKVALFKKVNSLIDINGMVLSPQAYAELNFTKWLKIRMGIGYNFYSFEDQSRISKSDLQNVSFTFGLFCGKFR